MYFPVEKYVNFILPLYFAASIFSTCSSFAHLQHLISFCKRFFAFKLLVFQIGFGFHIFGFPSFCSSSTFLLAPCNVYRMYHEFYKIHTFANCSRQHFSLCTLLVIYGWLDTWAVRVINLGGVGRRYCNSDPTDSDPIFKPVTECPLFFLSISCSHL